LHRPEIIVYVLLHTCVYHSLVLSLPRRREARYRSSYTTNISSAIRARFRYRPAFLFFFSSFMVIDNNFFESFPHVQRPTSILFQHVARARTAERKRVFRPTVGSIDYSPSHPSQLHHDQVQC
jgi:hypothetical protein